MQGPARLTRTHRARRPLSRPRQPWPPRSRRLPSSRGGRTAPRGPAARRRRLRGRRRAEEEEKRRLELCKVLPRREWAAAWAAATGSAKALPRRAHAAPVRLLGHPRRQGGCRGRNPSQPALVGHSPPNPREPAEPCAPLQMMQSRQASSWSRRAGAAGPRWLLSLIIWLLRAVTALAGAPACSRASVARDRRAGSGRSGRVGGGSSALGSARKAGLQALQRGGCDV